MKFEMSPNIAVPVKDPAKAIAFYTKVLGFKNHSADPAFGDIEAPPKRIYVQQDEELTGVVMELFVDDLEAAKNVLLANGCTLVRWEGLGKDCYIRDPFGLTFNLWQV